MQAPPPPPPPAPPAPAAQYSPDGRFWWNGQQWVPVGAAMPAGLPPLPPGVEPAGLGRRFGAVCLNFLLSIVTLGVGWMIWTLIVWSNGQNPGQQILGLRIVRDTDGRVPSWGIMFVRNFVLYGLLGNVFLPMSLYILALWPLWDPRRQELWDKMIGTIMVTDPHGALKP